MSRPVHELAAIIRQYKTSFTSKHQPLKQHLSVLNALEKCRTAALGGHVEGCDSCGHLHISYNPDSYRDRNRHCPKCQQVNKERWIMARQQSRMCGTGKLFSCGVYPDNYRDHRN